MLDAPPLLEEEALVPTVVPDMSDMVVDIEMVDAVSCL